MLRGTGVVGVFHEDYCGVAYIENEVSIDNTMLIEYHVIGAERLL